MEELQNNTQEVQKESAGFDWAKLILPGAIIIAGIMISVAVMYSSGGPNNTAKIGEILGGQQEASVDDDPFLGDKKAPVTVIEFSDYQCPFCRRYFETVEPQLKDYIKAGKVKFVYRDYAFLGLESNWAAQAANCANDQNKYWEYHDYLFKNQNGENQGAFSNANLKKFAGTLGLNVDEFSQCLDSEKYAGEVAKDVSDGSSYGVNGTPATFINGRLVATSDGRSVGAAPFSVFQSIIEAELNK